MSRDCKYLSTTVTFQVGSETFTCTGKTLLDPGYTTVMHWQAFGKNETVPTFTEGEMANIQDVSQVLLEQTGLFSFVMLLHKVYMVIKLEEVVNNCKSCNDLVMKMKLGNTVYFASVTFACLDNIMPISM